MKNLFSACISLVLLTTLLFTACQKENVAPSPETQQQDPQLAKIEATVDSAIAELEYDYNNPPSDEGTSSRAMVYLPAGSVDGLAAAIAEAGVNGRVIVESGDHWESGTVTIPHRVTIQGEPGAKLHVAVGEPGSFFPFPTTNVISPAIYVKKASLVRLKNLEIKPQGASGSTGIFVERSRSVRIEEINISGFQFGIWVSDRSDFIRLYDNEIVGSEVPGLWGVVIESGKGAKIKGNYVAGFASNVFASDKQGVMKDNEMELGFQGLLLCTVQGNVQLPNGPMLPKAVPCKDWKIINNLAHDNFWNYLAIDGANNNLLFRNKAYNSGSYDVELAGPTSRFGNPMPTSSDNFVVNPTKDIITKVCGEGNFALGGTKVNTNTDPCN